MPAQRKDYSKAVEMYEAGLSIGDVATFFGITRQAMWSILARRDVVFRSRWRFGPDNHFFRDGTPKDERVHSITTLAIMRGKLIPQPCEVCGSFRRLSDGRREVHGHHDDYNKPLEVRWLCGQHHREWHANNSPIRRSADLPTLPRDVIASLGGKDSAKARKRRKDGS